MFQKVTPAIAESWFQGKLSCRTGVLPLGAKVRTRRGRSLTLDPSMKTMVRPSLAPFFLVSADASSSNARSRLRLPPATARPLAGKVQFLDEPPHTRFRIPLGADLRNELGPARQRPRIGGISLRQGAGFERFDQSLLLGVGQPRRALGSAAPCATRRPSAIAYHDRFAVRLKRLLPAPNRGAADFEPARHLWRLHTNLQQTRGL